MSSNKKANQQQSILSFFNTTCQVSSNKRTHSQMLAGDSDSIKQITAKSSVKYSFNFSRLKIQTRKKMN